MGLRALLRENTYVKAYIQTALLKPGYIMKLSLYYPDISSFWRLRNVFIYDHTHNPSTIYSELWLSSPCSAPLPCLPETVDSCAKKYDRSSCSDFCSMLRSPADYPGSNRTLLFERLQEIRERLANTTVPGLCTFNPTGMQKSVHTSGSCLKQSSLRQGLGEITSQYICFKSPPPEKNLFLYVSYKDVYVHK